MRKSLTVLAAATTVTLVVGTLIGTALARPYYAYPYHGYGYGYGPYFPYSAYYYGRYGPPPDGYHYVAVPRSYYRVRRPYYGY